MKTGASLELVMVNPYARELREYRKQSGRLFSITDIPQKSDETLA